ncbi:MAG TPA: MMPL family transporter [Iamia sp.]|nr:MMPL family transporter [Iamia sp.]
MFARLGPWCHDRRKLVLLIWIVAFLVGGAMSGSGGSFKDEFNPPPSDSKDGFDLLEDDFGGQGTGFSGSIVFRADQGVDDPEVQGAMQDLFAKVAALPNVLQVVSPYDEAGAQQIADAGKIAYATVEMPTETSTDEAGEIRDVIIEDTPEIGGLQVERGGMAFGEFENPSSEALGLAFAIVILILAFGSVLAMGLPVGVALFGIGIGTGIVTVLSFALPIPEFATFLGVMIGLGVGIDYALLIVTRYREQLHRGHDVRESIAIAIDTAGRSVLFAGCTVAISLLSMMLIGVRFVQGLAVSSASVVAITVLASLTLLPALLGFAGERVELTRWRGLIAAGLMAVALLAFGLKITLLGLGAVVLALVVLVVGLFLPTLKGEVARREQKPRDQTFAYRWSRFVQHRPWIVAIGATVVLLVVAIPVLSLRLGFSDESNFADDTTTKKAYDLQAEGFGEGAAGPLLLVAALPDGTDPASLDGVEPAVRTTPGVTRVSPAQPDDPESPSAVRWFVQPDAGPQTEATAALVDRLRDDVLPPLESASGVEIHVTGSTAGSLDFSDYLQSRLPYFFITVLALSFLLLMVVFRSVLVPLKAVIMNLLSIGAAYGIVVALFQWGWLSDLTGVQPAPIEPWAPMMLFAIVFGLSMDYEVFLLSRVREEWHRTGDSHTSVADGLAATAKVITAAAAIMVVVFGSFLLESDRVLKLMGTGLATAILLDATIVRMLLVPATMELLGDRNWWLPRWLDKLLPTIDVEGHADDDDDDVEQAPREPVPV